jgi:predicted nucleotidyltransferase
MIEQKYLDWLQQIIRSRFANQDIKAFVFGSAIDRKRKNFFDVDLGVSGDIDEFELHNFREELEESNFPYKVDIINFNTVKKGFADAVFSDKVVWL